MTNTLLVVCSRLAGKDKLLANQEHFKLTNGKAAVIPALRVGFVHLVV